MLLWILILKAVLESVLHADHFEYKVDYGYSSNKKIDFFTIDPLTLKFQFARASLKIYRNQNFFYQSNQGPQRPLYGLGH